MDKLGYVNCIRYPTQTIAKPNKSYNAVENETVTSKGQKSNTSENGDFFFVLHNFRLMDSYLKLRGCRIGQKHCSVK